MSSVTSSFNDLLSKVAQTIRSSSNPIMHLPQAHSFTLAEETKIIEEARQQTNMEGDPLIFSFNASLIGNLIDSKALSSLIKSRLTNSSSGSFSPSLGRFLRRLELSRIVQIPIIPLAEGDFADRAVEGPLSFAYSQCRGVIVGCFYFDQAARKKGEGEEWLPMFDKNELASPSPGRVLVWKPRGRDILEILDPKTCVFIDVKKCEECNEIIPKDELQLHCQKTHSIKNNGFVSSAFYQNNTHNMTSHSADSSSEQLSSLLTTSLPPPPGVMEQQRESKTQSSESQEKLKSSLCCLSPRPAVPQTRPTVPTTRPPPLANSNGLQQILRDLRVSDASASPDTDRCNQPAKLCRAETPEEVGPKASFLSSLFNSGSNKGIELSSSHSSSSANQKIRRLGNISSSAHTRRNTANLNSADSLGVDSSSSDADLAIKEYGDVNLFTELKRVCVCGQGAEGIVYRCERAGDPKQLYALKIIDCTSKNANETFRITKKLMQRMEGLHSSDHLIKYLAVKRVESEVHVVMPFYKGGTLDGIIRRTVPSKIDYMFTLSIILQIACALKELHADNIAHNDIKSSNVMLYNNDTQVVLMDLENAVTLDPVIKNFKYTTTPAGTREWMAPETLQNWRVTFTSDLWAVGLIFFTMIALPEFLMFENAKVGQEEMLNDPDWDQESIDKLIKSEFAKKRAPTCCLNIALGLLRLKPEERFTSAKLETETINAMESILLKKEKVKEKKK